MPEPEETIYGDYLAVASSKMSSDVWDKPPSRPKVKPGPASDYQGLDETILEFSHHGTGGLLSIRRDYQGRLLVEVYRADDDVVIRAAWSERATKLIDQYLAEEKTYSDLFDKNADLTTAQYQARDDWRAQHLVAVMDLLQGVIR